MSHCISVVVYRVMALFCVFGMQAGKTDKQDIKKQLKALPYYFPDGKYWS